MSPNLCLHKDDYYLKAHDSQCIKEMPTALSSGRDISVPCGYGQKAEDQKVPGLLYLQQVCV